MRSCSASGPWAPSRRTSPFGSVLNSAIDPLLDIMSRVEQTSENERGFVQLASRIELLTPIVADKKAQEGKQIVESS
ncbi:hypothetical protein HMN09_01051100 [Mycena chlorophos]|uniref:Uncharacterized protein n=1 Tax=Mycena chlorophos TaxID=658473 RepID=A0A8H6VWI2_MYCCL|nr:hypothetical protein HMN09_01051100 [Mycena chlorophos]